MKNKKIFFVIGLFLVMIITFFYLKNSNDNVINIDMDIDDGDQKIDWSLYETTSYQLTKSITITDGGIYNLTGTITDGVITIDTKEDVKLVLNNVNITNTKGPAIYVKNANNTVIELTEDTYNYLKDGTTYLSYDEDEVGTIFSHDDLIFQGTGTLEVISNNEDAIVSKDDLKIISGTYIITSKDDGIRGKDSVYIQSGTFTINSMGDGIKSTNEEDTDKGFVLIENGNFDITSTLDGITSKNKMLIENGTFNIQTGSGSSNSSDKDTWGFWRNKTSKTTESAKGIKAGNNLVIENGNFNFDTSDDAIHCNGYIGIKDGMFNISSGDDGIHSDIELIIDNGTINITKSYEGLESAKITINNGKINVTSSDDGINVAGGKDSSAKNRPGENNYASNDNILTINDGVIVVNASGDGIDANGSVYMNGGIVTVYGPTDNANGALDYDNTFIVNGGTLLAGGSSGMMQGVSSTSQYNLSINFNSSYNSDDVIKIVDKSNQEIVTYQSSKTYSSLVVSSPLLKKDETYTIKINDTTYQTFTISSMTTTIGTRVMGNMPPDGKGNRR